MHLKQCFAVGVFALAAGAAISDAAQAAPITETLTFSATVATTGAPYSTVSGSATLSFDPAANQAVTPVAAFSSTLPASYSPFSFSYIAAFGILLVGDDCPTIGICTASSGSDTAYFGFQVDVSGAPVGGVSVVYGSISNASDVFEGSGSASVVNPVPEPASIALFATVLAGLGLIRGARRS